jgi:hypothetical protein
MPSALPRVMCLLPKAAIRLRLRNELHHSAGAAKLPRPQTGGPHRAVIRKVLILHMEVTRADIPVGEEDGEGTEVVEGNELKY